MYLVYIMDSSIPLAGFWFIQKFQMDNNISTTFIFNLVLYLVLFSDKWIPKSELYSPVVPSLRLFCYRAYRLNEWINWNLMKYLWSGIKWLKIFNSKCFDIFYCSLTKKMPTWNSSLTMSSFCCPFLVNRYSYL